MANQKNDGNEAEVEKPEKKKVTCGLIMPMSFIDGCPKQHWDEVEDIITETIEGIEEYECTVNMVSHANEVRIIQETIIHNLFKQDMVICDVSGKNPNVMFELGIRLTFDKAVVLVKDDQTEYSFDTGMIRHIEYPRDLRYKAINDFKKDLRKRFIATFEESRKEDYSAFLRHFGPILEAKPTLKSEKVPMNKEMLDLYNRLVFEMKSIKFQLGNVNNNSSSSNRRFLLRVDSSFENEIREEVDNYLTNLNPLSRSKIDKLINNHEFSKFIGINLEERGICIKNLGFLSDIVNNHLQRTILLISIKNDN